MLPTSHPASESRSLADVHASVGTSQVSFWKRLFAFAGPAYLVSVGYMDPGNWATDLEGGARFGIRTIEAVVLSLIVVIATCFGIEMFWAKPAVSELFTGLVPRLDGSSLYVAIGIIGATVMPHNLYLHSALVQTRNIGQSETA